MLPVVAGRRDLRFASQLQAGQRGSYCCQVDFTRTIRLVKFSRDTIETHVFDSDMVIESKKQKSAT
jgi:hypothetical protein